MPLLEPRHLANSLFSFQPPAQIHASSTLLSLDTAHLCWLSFALPSTHWSPLRLDQRWHRHLEDRYLVCWALECLTYEETLNHPPPHQERLSPLTEAQSGSQTKTKKHRQLSVAHPKPPPLCLWDWHKASLKSLSRGAIFAIFKRNPPQTAETLWVSSP